MMMIFGRTCSSIQKLGLVRPPSVFRHGTISLRNICILAFIRGLLENVGAEIDPIRLIRRIRNGLEIPGLKGALIKILHDFNLQVSLLEGCQTILYGDCSDLARTLHLDQTSGFLLNGTSQIRLTVITCSNNTLVAIQERQRVRYVQTRYWELTSRFCFCSCAATSYTGDASLRILKGY